MAEIKVAMVNTALNKGGAARMAMTLLLAERQLGLDVTLYHAQDDIYNKPYHGLKRPLSRPINALLARLGGANWGMDLGFTGELLRWTQNADVLHIHNLHGYYLDYQKLLLSWADRPIVWTWHDMWGATGRCGFAFDCEAWKTGCKKCMKKCYYPAAWLDNANTEYLSKDHLYKIIRNLWIVTPSEWLKNIAIERGFSPDRVMAIPNPVDLNKYQVHDRSEARRKLGLNPDKIYLLFVAADCNDPRKGYKDFVDIVQKGKGWQGLVVGVPPLQRCPDFNYVGIIEEPEKMSLYYSAANLFVITSYADNYPNTVIEALACDTPVVGYATGGIPSQVPDPEAFLAPQHDLTGLYIKVLEALQRFGEQTKLYRNRKFAQDRWSPDSIAGRYISAYETAIGINND